MHTYLGARKWKTSLLAVTKSHRSMRWFFTFLGQSMRRQRGTRCPLLALKNFSAAAEDSGPFSMGAANGSKQSQKVVTLRPRTSRSRHANSCTPESLSSLVYAWVCKLPVSLLAFTPAGFCTCLLLRRDHARQKPYTMAAASPD
jgi:hypothetical protein